MWSMVAFDEIPALPIAAPFLITVVIVAPLLTS